MTNQGPPNLRDAECCGDCKHYLWTHGGGYSCTKHDQAFPKSYQVCDDWESGVESDEQDNV